MVLATGERVKMVPVALIDTDPSQPREVFDPEALEKLRKSIASDGLNTPITVRPRGERYEIVTGERRFRAISMLEWKTVPAFVRDMDEAAFRRLQLLENVVREGLNPVEYCTGLKLMLDEGMSPKDVGECLGEDPGNVTYLVKILECRPEVLALIASKQIGVVVGRQLANLDWNAQLTVLRKFQSHSYDCGQQTAICQAEFTRINQGQMMEEVLLNSEQAAVVKQLKTAFGSACDAFNRLKGMEEKDPGIIIQANLTQLDIARAQVSALKKDVDWLYRILKQKEALEDGRRT